MNANIFYLFFLLLFISCGDEEVNDPRENDYLIFGHFYGECIGEYCVEIYKLEDGKLYEDTNDNYPSNSGPYIGDFLELSQDQYNLVKDLNGHIPEELIEIMDIIVGCPDCSDGGGVYLEIKEDGEIRYWMIDQFINNIPETIHGLVKEVNTKIALLQ